MQRIEFNAERFYTRIEIAGNQYLFSSSRIKKESIPEGMYMYEIADADGDGCISRVQPYVLVNFWGTIIGKDPVPLDETGHYYPEDGSDEYLGLYGEEMTLREYLTMEEIK